MSSTTGTAGRSSRSSSSSPRRSAAPWIPRRGQPLVDVVLDKAGQKGTGKWTAQVALDLAVRDSDDRGGDRRARALEHEGRARRGGEGARRAATPRRLRSGRRARQVIADLHDALYAARICAYAQGMALIRAGSEPVQLEHQPRGDRPHLEGRLHHPRAPARSGAARVRERRRISSNLLLDPALADGVDDAQAGWRRTVARAAEAGIPMLSHATALGYFDSYRAAAPAAEPHAGAARRLRRAHLRAHRSPRRRAQRVVR